MTEWLVIFFFVSCWKLSVKCVNFIECITRFVCRYKQFVHILIRFIANRHIAFIESSTFSSLVIFTVILFTFFFLTLFFNRYPVLNFELYVMPVPTMFFSLCFAENRGMFFFFIFILTQYKIYLHNVIVIELIAIHWYWYYSVHHIEPGWYFSSNNSRK